MRKFYSGRFNSGGPTYIIAEIGINHGGDVSTAKKLIDSAAKTGCNAVKFQTYVTENRAPEGYQKIFDLLKSCELPFSDFEKLKIHSEEHGLDFLSTPFDFESVKFLESIDVDAYKIASFDVTNKELLRVVSQTEKPVIMSVGMSNLEEIRDACELLNRGKHRCALLHCVSSYPTEEQDANLRSIAVLAREFSNCVIGLSDHTTGIRVPLYAVAMGAQIIEKHYKISDDMECVDGPVSISERTMGELVREVRNLERILGEYHVGFTDPQSASLVFRRVT